MLDSMRGLAKSFIAKALMFFLVLTFAVWGAGDVVRGGGNNYLVKVGDEQITPNQFLAEERMMRNALESMGVRGTDPRALQEEILRRMVQQKLVAQWQKETGLSVTRETLLEAIAQSPEFKGDDGRFDPGLFTMALQQRQVTEKGYLAQLSNDLGSRAMLASIATADIAPPAALRALALAAGTQTRDVALITIPAVKVAPASVTQEALDEYYEMSQDDFAQPERRTVEYVALDPEAVKTLVEKAVTDDMRAAEQREQAIDELAMAIEDGLAAGSSMGEAVAGAGLHAQSRVLKDITARQFDGNGDALLRAVAAQAFDLSEGESSSMQATEDGRYFLVSVTKVDAAAPRALAEVEAEVRKAAAGEQSRDATRARVQEVKQALAGGTDWKEAARAAGAATREVRDVARPAPDAKDNHGPVPLLLQQAVFEHKTGGVAGPMARADGEQVLAVVTAVRTHPAADGKAARQAADDYERQLGNAVSGGVFRALSQRYRVVVNQPLLAQLQSGQVE